MYKSAECHLVAEMVVRVSSFHFLFHIYHCQTEAQLSNHSNIEYITNLYWPYIHQFITKNNL